MGLVRAALPPLYVGVWVGASASTPDLNDNADALLFALAAASAHVAVGYALREWAALLLALTPVVLEPLVADPRWIPLVFIAYGIPAAVFLALGVAMAKIRAFRRRAEG